MKRLALILLLAACSGTTIQTPTRSFDRPADVALFCMRFDPNPTQRVWNTLPIETCSADASNDPNNIFCGNTTGTPGETPANNCIDANGAQDYVYRPQLGGLVANSARGEVALVDILNGLIVDLEPLIPGFQFLEVGAMPEHIRATHDGCRSVTANVDSCNLSVIDVQRLANVPFLPFRDPTGDAGVTISGPTTDAGAPIDVYLRSVTETVTLSAGGKPLYARPGWVEIAPESTDGHPVSGICDDGMYNAWVSLPACQAVVEVPLVGPNAGVVMRALAVTQTGTHAIDPATLTCPIECLAQPGTQTGFAVDLGADAAVVPDGGAPNPPPRVPTTQSFPGSIAIDVENGVGRMFIADQVSRRITIVPIDPTSGAPSPARAIDLAEQPVGVDTVRVSPRSEAGKFLYAVARDASVRVIDLDREVECETNPDPNDPALAVPTNPAQEPPIDPQPLARHFGCFPLGDPSTPARSPLSTGPGITLPINALPRDVAFVHLDLQPPPTTNVSTPPSAGPRVMVGDFAWIIGSDGRSMAVNVYDACPAPNIPQQQSSGNFSATCDPTQAQLSRDQSIAEPENPVPTFYDRVAHRPRRGTDRFSPPLNCADPASGAPRLASENFPLTINFSSGTGASTQITQGATDAGAPQDLGVAEDMSAPDGGVATSSVFSIPNLVEVMLPQNEQNSCANVKSVGFNPYDTKNDTWTLDWEGVIPTTARSSGVVGKSDPTLFIDSGGAWCTRGAKAGDKLELVGCNQDSDCDINATCQKSTTAPPDVTTGLCLPGTAAGLPGAANLDSLKNECTPLLNAKLRFRVISAKQGTTLTFGNTPQAQVTDALKLAEIYEPEYSFQSLDCSTDETVCTNVSVVHTNADGTTTNLPTHCVQTLDERGGSVKRCVRTCDDGLGCGQDFQCLPSRYGDQRCMYAPLSTQLFTDCLPELQKYQLRVGDAFMVTGQANGFYSDLEPSPVDRECTLPVNATAPFVKLRQSRIPLDAKKLMQCPMILPYQFLPSSFATNTCWMADDTMHTVVHFENPWFAFAIDVPKIPNGNFVPVVRPPPSLQLTFQIVGGQGALSIPLASDVQAQQPRMAVTAPDHQTVYIIDEGKQTTATGLRGQLLRLVSGSQSVDRNFQVR
jgi:hypothetical protein